MFDVTALGEILIDFTAQGVNKQGQKIFVQNPGGAPANVLAAVTKLGGRGAFIGKVGNDMHGKFLQETLKKCKVDESGLILSEEYFTTLAFVNVRSDGEREFSFARNHGADKMLTKEEIRYDIIKNSKIFHIGSISLTDEPSKSATVEAIKKAKEFGCIISYDPNYRKNLWRNEEEAKNNMRSILKYADLIKISDEETELLTGKSSHAEAAKILLNHGATAVVVTLGKDGAYVQTAEGGVLVEGFTSKAIDATGAGDSFWGGFLYKLSNTCDSLGEITMDKVKNFAKFGNAVASLCVENYGAIPSMPDMDKVEARLHGE